MKNSKYLLPYGDALREFLNQPNITKADVKSILRQRGVFFEDTSKKNMIPLLIKTGVSPLELGLLQEKLKRKEENLKQITQSIPWAGSECMLMEAITNNLSLEGIVDEPFANHKIIGAPSFKNKSTDGSLIEMDFIIERYDYSQGWNKNISQFPGKIILEKPIDSNNISIKIIHTAPETKSVASKILRKQISHLKESGFIDNKSKIMKIKFSDFSNQNRILFLKNLSQNEKNHELVFIEIKSIGFKPDLSIKLPKNLLWMEEKIKNLDLEGNKLQNTFFIKDPQYYDHIEVYKMESEYYFDYDEIIGTCSISFQFSEFIKKSDRDTELTINIEKLNLSKNALSISNDKIKEKVLSQLEGLKLNLHELYSTKELQEEGVGEQIALF